MKKIIMLLIVIVGFITVIPVHAEMNNGDYSIDYLLRNYNLVTLGQKNISIPEIYASKFAYINKGDFYYSGYGDGSSIPKVEGAVIINGNFASNNNLILGSNNSGVKSFIKGNVSDTITVQLELEENSNYIDFQKAYNQILNESKSLLGKATHNLNTYRIEISEPGNYVVQNTSRTWYANHSCDNNKILISNYDKNEMYIFNYYDEYIEYLPRIEIMESGSPTAISLKDYIENNDYTGNIIFNFPNALYISVDIVRHDNVSDVNPNFFGHIIAPKANLYYGFNESRYRGTVNHFYGTVIVNSIYSYNSILYVGDTPYSNNKKVLIESGSHTLVENEDFIDDYYTRDYSISDLLQNYSLVTLGHNQINSK